MDRVVAGLARCSEVYRSPGAEQKSTLELRLIVHRRDDTSVGHIVVDFLALRPPPRFSRNEPGM